MATCVLAFQPRQKHIEPHSGSFKVANGEAAVGNKPNNGKETKEALELKEVFEAKRKGSKKLLIAQIAPSVR